jgi:hypothetical protein
MHIGHIVYPEDSGLCVLCIYVFIFHLSKIYTMCSFYVSHVPMCLSSFFISSIELINLDDCNMCFFQ